FGRRGTNAHPGGGRPRTPALPGTVTFDRGTVPTNRLMDIKRGIAVSPGVAIGPALVLDTEWYRLPQRYIDPQRCEEEVERLRRALAKAASEAVENQEAVSLKLGPQYGAIFGAHALMLADPSLLREIETLVRTEHFAVEYAVSRVIRRYA